MLVATISKEKIMTIEQMKSKIIASLQTWSLEDRDGFWCHVEQLEKYWLDRQDDNTVKEIYWIHETPGMKIYFPETFPQAFQQISEKSRD